MALSKEQIKADYPLPIYNYRVDIDADTIAFSEVSGLDISLETITYNESQVDANKTGPNTMYMPSWQKPLNITLKKGFVRRKSIPVLYNWINDTELNTVTKKDITVHLCDERGNSVVRWKVIDAFPIKLSAPTFDAGGNDAAIETMELMASALVMNEE